MHQTSPGVDRAVTAARVWADRSHAPEVRLADYVLGLLDEEDGRPAVLLDRLGLPLDRVRESLRTLPLASYLAPPLSVLLGAARAWSLAHRADPDVMTDAFLVAVLSANAAFMQGAAGVGLEAQRLMTLMTEGDSPFARPDDPTAAFVMPDMTEEMDAARALDVNLNRCREALRILEDYCRFVLNDRFLTEQFKEARHGLAEVAAQLPPGLLLRSRDILGDVGTTVTGPGEYDRHSPAHIAAVNAKRCQESLRSLEEYAKLFGPHLGRQLEALRYRLYTLERAVVGGGNARERLAEARLYVLLTGAQCQAALDWVIEQAAAGGASVFQLREKTLPDRELIERARAVRRWTQKCRALFIVNDRPDIARLVGADGVHLGQDDLPVREARRILGPNALIGVSTHTLEQARQAVLEGADYIGVGPTFPSRTKPFDQFPGLAFIQEVTAETGLPAFALGGIGPENVGQVVAAGARRIAVSAAVAGSDDPERVARLLRTALDG